MFSETIMFGKYYKNNTNEKEPIEWVVLKQDSDNTILVIAKNAIDCRLFDSKKENVFFGNSEICNYLNNEFYQEAFSEQEKECIRSSTISNDICSRFNKENSEIQNNEEEYNVFLLSNDEINNYLPEIGERKCKATSYSKQKGAFVEFGNYCWWWLRNQGYYPNRASYVDNYGQIVENGANVNCNDICVRPAIWINIIDENLFRSVNTEVCIYDNIVQNDFISYLYPAYMNRIPIILSGTNSMRLALELTDYIDGHNNSYSLDCNNNIDVNTPNKAVIITNLIESKRLVEIVELLEKRENFYIIVIPQKEDIRFLPYSFYDYALPIILDYLNNDLAANNNIDIISIKNLLKQMAYTDFSNQISELMNNLGVSKLTQWYYLILLSDNYYANNTLSDKEFLLLMLSFYVYATNRIELINCSNFDKDSFEKIYKYLVYLTKKLCFE